MTIMDSIDTRAHVRRVCWWRRSNCLLLCFLTPLYICYLLLGALVFLVLERPVEMEMMDDLFEKKAQLLRDHPCLKDEALEDFIRAVISANNRGVTAVNNVTSEPNWSFGQSLFFSGTVITTIGYGHVTPLSQGGKIFCIVYSLVGIPLTLILLTAYVERLMIPTTLFLQFLNSRLGHLYQPFNIRILHFSIVTVLVISLFFLVPASLFQYLEPGWDYLDSLYYCFISLTTIGLGDYVPGDTPNQPLRALYKACTTGYLLVGLTFMMLFLSVLYDIPQLNFGLFFLMKSDEMTSDPEKMRLHPNMGTLGQKYMQQIDEPAVRHIRAVPQPSSSSPEENP